jgi:hypothetical protein
MKNSLLSLAFIFLTINYGLCQESTETPRSYMGVGFDWGFFESNAQGIKYSAEYGYSLNTNFTINTSVAGGMALASNGTSYTNYSYIGTSIGIRVVPFANKFNRLKLDAGGFYQYMHETSGTTSETADQFGYYNLFATFAKHNHFGFWGAVSINIIQTKKLEIGLKAQGNRYPEWKLGTYQRQLGIYSRVKF